MSIDFFNLYKSTLTGEEHSETLPLDMTPEEHTEWEAYLFKAGEEWLKLQEALQKIEATLTEDLELPPKVKDWSCAQTILFFQAIEDYWFCEIFRLGILNLPNVGAVMDVLKSRIEG